MKKPQALHLKNSQSLNRICVFKFDELTCFIQNFNTQHPISSICLNECWILQENDTPGLLKVQIERTNIFKFDRV